MHECANVCVANVWIIYSQPTSSRDNYISSPAISKGSVCVRAREWVFTATHLFLGKGGPGDIYTVTEVRKKPISTCQSGKPRASVKLRSSLPVFTWENYRERMRIPVCPNRRQRQVHGRYIFNAQYMSLVKSVPKQTACKHSCYSLLSLLLSLRPAETIKIRFDRSPNTFFPFLYKIQISGGDII